METGGPIGLKATGYVARLTMDRWIQLFRQKLEDHGLIIKLLKKYVDDVVVVVDNIKPGSRLEEGQLRYRSEWEEEDKRQGVTPDQNTMRYLNGVANSFFKFLQFTTEVSEGESKRIPVLDSMMWYGNPSSQEPWFQTGEGMTPPGQGEIWNHPTDRKTVLYTF